jgi:CspA family cold shock protein
VTDPDRAEPDTETSAGDEPVDLGVTEEGTVRWYSLAKGYGFVARDDTGEDVFVHHSAIVGPEPLLEGERVRYQLVKAPKGLRAQRVTRVE